MTTIQSGFGAFTRRTSRRLKLLLSAGVIALAGISTSAAPARAQSSDDVIRFLLGAAAVAVVVRAIDSSAAPRRDRLRHGTLPAACLETLRVNRQHVDVYHTGCLGWYGINRLPQRCEARVRTDRGGRSYHLAQCLHRSGWTPEYASVPQRPRQGPPPRADYRRDCPPGWQGRGHHRRDSRCGPTPGWARR
ncbi:hypothetical protein [Pararhodobacter sp. SW119]|uniref:hypothetical protein n=1 Tax=Pararhodobacter sp. SW119 TaxID=2780075 RepID=UPI001ADF99BE|nr:hypothetical protein [Pararhodobacter sp. SW119]